MKRSYRIITITILLALVLCLAAVSISANDSMEAHLVYIDRIVYAGGYYDMIAGANVAGAAYQWCARYGYDGSFTEIYDNERYFGTNTEHFRFLTADGYEYGTDWDHIHFACKVTFPDGTVKMTEAYNMHIYSSKALVSEMNRLGLKISEFGLKGFQQNEVILDVPYYYIRPGNPVSFICSYDELDSIYSESELKTGLEITVNEGGKIRKLQSPQETITPRKANEMIVIKAELVLYLNDVRYMTLDSKQIVVRTTYPEWESVATLKTSGAVLAGQYNESERLAYLSPNDTVFIIENTGTWCLVVYNDVVGYIPSSSLNILKNIPEVSISIQEPVYGVPVTFSAKVSGKGYGLYSNDPVMWYDLTAGRFLENGDMFLLNHQYMCTVWLEADTDHVFSVTQEYDSAVTGIINGTSVTAVKAYEQDPAEVIEINYKFSHLHDPQKVTQKNPSCTKDGKLTYYHCYCGDDFVDNRGLEKITDENWGIIPATGHWESEWRSDGEHHYKYCQRRECGEIIGETIGYHEGGQADCKSQAICSVCNLPYGELGTHIWSDKWDYSDETGHAHSCTSLLCSEHSEIKPHVPGTAATAASPQICTECGYILGHMTAVNPFEDISENDYFYDAVLWAYYADPQVTNGVSATRFGPDSTCTRAQVMTFLWRAMGCPEPGSMNNPFKDVPENTWYTKAVLWAVENGITNGVSSDRFAPDSTCTRAHVITFLYRSFGSPDFTGKGNWYDDAVLWAVKNKLISETVNEFKPSENCPRKDIVLYLYRKLG